MAGSLGVGPMHLLSRWAIPLSIARLCGNRICSWQLSSATIQKNTLTAGNSPENFIQNAGSKSDTVTVILGQDPLSFATSTSISGAQKLPGRLSSAYPSHRS